MRNLQKILALVLALIMSFSLVATAGAFSDDGDISDAYKDAVTVLNGLEVFKGYDNGATFQPKGNITRAEVAAIIYRIATGDVTDSQASIYTSYNQFTDVLDGSWYSGYVNYCANAGYIKGRGNKIFDPQSSVTGYEALAMILRAVGYDKNGEFTGSNWQTRTASIANERGITKNVTSAMLGQAATRDMVAEILFRAILVNQVNFNANTLSYTAKDTSLGYDTFKLEEVTGVVVANEFADLYDTDVLAGGKTDLEVNGEVRHLDYASELTDIGESRHAYIAASKVLHLGDTGTNVVYETGAKVDDVSTDKKFEDEFDQKKNDDTEFYVNFGHDADWQSDWRIRYEFSLTVNSTGDRVDALDEARDELKADRYYGLTLPSDAKDTAAVKDNGDGTWTITYSKSFKIDEHITPVHQDNIEAIFNIADKRVDAVGIYDRGEVYVGTSSVKDVSDEISFNQFKKEYIKEDNYDDDWTKSDNGEWVKIVDNNSDGTAEYAFLTTYTLDEITHTRTVDGETVMEYKSLLSDKIDEDDGVTLRYLDSYEPAVGDIVLYSVIDGQALIQKVEPVKATVSKIDFKNETITTTGGDDYGQSGIENETEKDDVITKMDEKVEYNLYLDKYNYVRAYDLSEGTKYGLITELYYGYKQNGRFQTSKDLTVEMRSGSEKINEYLVTNAGTNRTPNEFVGYENWLQLGGIYLGAYKNIGLGLQNQEDLAEQNVLQPATAHLGLSTEGKYTGQNVNDYFNNTLTNVAKYTKDGDDVKLTSASEYAYEKGTNRQLYYTWNARANAWEKTTSKTEYPVYASDYIELAKPTEKLAEDTRVFSINVSDNNKNNVGDVALLNSYVNAVNDTEFYIVSEGNQRVAYFTGYKNVPEIKSDKINAMYAVAQNTTADDTSKDYWVADVVVIEVDNWTDDYDSISLAYYTNNYNGGTVRSLDTINNKTTEKLQTVVPNPNDYTWNFRDWRDSDYGFYRLYDTTTDGSVTTADDLDKIPGAGEKFKDYDIYAGVITRINVIDDSNRGNYIMVNGQNGTNYDVSVDNAKVYGIVELANQVNHRTEAQELHMCGNTRHTQVKEGDRIIWIGGDDSANFIVVVSYKDGDNVAPAWLTNYGFYDSGLYNDIIVDQKSGVTPVPTYNINVNYVVDNGEATDVAPEGVTVTVDGSSTTTGLANGAHTLTLAVDATKYTVNTGSDLQVGDQVVTISGADVTVTVRLTSVGSEQPGTDVTLKLDPNFATWVWNDINDKTAGKTEFAIQASAAVKAVDGKATINPKTVVSNWTEEFVAEDAGDWNIELATNDSSVATFNYDTQMIELTGAAEGTELTIGLVCLKGPAWITDTNTEDPGGSTVNPGGGFDRPGGFSSRARIARAGESEPQKFVRGEKYPYYFILPSTMTIQSITVNEVDYDVDAIIKVGEGNTPETAGQTLYSIELTYTGGNYRISVTVTETPTDVVPVTLRLNGVPEGVDTIKVNGEARVPAGNQASAVKNEDGTYTATFAVELPANYKIRFNGGTAEQDTTAAGNVWNLTVTAAEADKESGKNVLATVIPGLLVEAAAQDTVLFGDQNYRRTVIELQGADLAVDADYKVTGAVKYIEGWTAFGTTGPSGENEQNGYYVVLKLTNPGKVASTIVPVSSNGNSGTALTNDNPDANGQEYGILVRRLKLKNNIPEPISVKANGETYTIDVSGVTLVKDGVSSNLVVEAATDTDYANNDAILGSGSNRKTVKELQNGITAVDNGDSTWTVAGVSNYVTGFTAWDSTGTGNYIALKLSYPGVEATDIKVVGTDSSERALVKDGTTADGDEYGILVWKITWQANGNAKPITVKAGGKTYTIKLNVTNGDPNESLYVTGAVDGDVAEDDPIIGADNGRKTIAQLQSDVTADFVDSNGTIKVHGTVNYVTGFTAWDSNGKGYYIALQFAHDTVANTEITVDSSDNHAKPLGDDGILIWKIDGQKVPEERLIKVTAQGKTYTVDLSDVTLKESGDLVLTPMTGTLTDNEFDSKDISVLQDIELVPDGDSQYVAKGTIFYNSWTKGFSGNYNPGWYIALNLYAPGGAKPSVWNTASGESGNWTEITDGELVWMIGNENKKATEIKIKAFDKLYTIDLTELNFDTELEVTAGKGTDGKYFERPVSDIQDIDVSVDETTKTVKVSGTAYYQDNWTDWSNDAAHPEYRNGYFIALHFKTPGDGAVVVKNGLNENAKTSDLNGGDLVLKVGDLKGNVLSPDRTFVIVKDNNSPDTGVIQVYTLDLSDLDFVDVNGQSDVAAYAMDDIGYGNLNDVTEWVVE